MFDQGFSHEIPEIFGPRFSTRAPLTGRHVMHLDAIYRHVWMSTPVRRGLLRGHP